MNSGVRRPDVKVSIGMPVYNAERFVEQALESLLYQTFEDFEIIISDNASTDATGDICLQYAEKDERIKYVRNRQNYGVIHNFNEVFRLSSGPYFKWAAADDICGPRYLERAVQVLDEDASVVLAWAKVEGIDGDGEPVAVTEVTNEVSDLNGPESVYSSDPVARFRRLMRNMWWANGPFYGLMRSDALASTALHRAHTSGDQILLTELCFLGRFFEIPDEVFYTRIHVNKTSYSAKSLRERAAVIEARPLGNGFGTRLSLLRHYPQRLKMYSSIVSNASIDRRQKAACFAEIAHTAGWWLVLRGGQWLSRGLRS